MTSIIEITSRIVRIFFLVAGFSLWLYAETKLRDIDIQLFKLEQKIKEELKNE